MVRNDENHALTPKVLMVRNDENHALTPKIESSKVRVILKKSEKENGYFVWTSYVDL